MARTPQTKERMLHRFFASTACLLLLFASTVAAADDDKSPDPDDTPRSPASASERTQSHAVDVFGTMQFAGPQAGTYRSSLIAASGLQVGLGYRVSRGFSLDVLFSSWSGQDAKLLRGAVEGRGHMLRSNTVDVWGGGELGVGVASSTRDTCYDACGSSASASAPLFGGGLGVDLLASYVSIGAEARALLALPNGGVAPIYVFGLTLGVHLPTE